jgi:hypothetical protein
MPSRRRGHRPLPAAAAHFLFGRTLNKLQMNQVFSDSMIKQDELIRYTKLGMNYVHLHVIYNRLQHCLMQGKNV